MQLSASELQAKKLEREHELAASAKVLEELMQKTSFQADDQEKLAAAFHCIDEDHSGRVNYEEFWAALSSICHNLREQVVLASGMRTRCT